MELILPVKSVVLFIAIGTLIFVIVFIFAKRQITRFALKSTRHIPIGADAPKPLKQEIERRLRRTADIKYEPHLMSQATELTIQNTFKNGETCHFLYRMKAVDAIKLLDCEMHAYSSNIVRTPMHNLRAFLLEQRQSGALKSCKLDLIEKFADAYDHARHDPADFKQEHYQEYMDLLSHLIEYVRNNKNAKEGTTFQISSKPPPKSEYLKEKPKLVPLSSSSQPPEFTLETGPEIPLFTGIAMATDAATMTRDIGDSAHEVTYRPHKLREGQRPKAMLIMQQRESSSSQSSAEVRHMDSTRLDGASQRDSGNLDGGHGVASV